MPTPTTVRIAVAVNSLGDICAWYSDRGDDMAEAIGCVRDGCALSTYWVEAVVEIPDPIPNDSPVVAGTVTPA
jgi:hypothetical protein